jgi:hypothetical protein
LNPQHCGADPVAIDLGVAEEAWALSQISYASSNLPDDYISLTDCIAQRYPQIGQPGSPYQFSQASASQFTPLTNVKQVDRSANFECTSQANSNNQVKAGPSGVFWADQGEDLIFAWRGTALDSQLKDEIENVAVEYLNPLGQSLLRSTSKLQTAKLKMSEERSIISIPSLWICGKIRIWMT